MVISLSNIVTVLRLCCALGTTEMLYPQTKPCRSFFLSRGRRIKNQHRVILFLVLSAVIFVLSRQHGACTVALLEGYVASAPEMKTFEPLNSPLHFQVSFVDFNLIYIAVDCAEEILGG